MIFIDKIRSKNVYHKLIKFCPALAFLGGFFWDSMTIGNKVYGLDLVILSFYYLLAFVCIYLLSSKKKDSSDCDVQKKDLADKEKKATENIKWQMKLFFNRFLNETWPSSWINCLGWLIQFCFGNLYSALVISYFKSSGSIASIVIVLILVVLLVCNEFLKERYENFGICLAFFSLLGTMFFNFLIPYLIHGMGTFWFFLSTFLSLITCFLLWINSSRCRRFLLAPFFITLLLSLAFVANWIPPVPLVLKQQLVCKNFDLHSYSCDADKPDFWQQTGLRTMTIHKNDTDEVYFMSSIYAPAELKAPIEFRWYYKDPSSKKFIMTDRISSNRMVVQGGRDAGYRCYSKKKNIMMGVYRVETAYKDGAVIGACTFKVLNETTLNSFVRDSLR